MQYSPIAYYRHAEASPTKTMVATTGSVGNYNGAVGIVPQTAIYTGGPTCMLGGGEDTDRTWGNVETVAMPALSNLTLVWVSKFIALPAAYAPVGINADHLGERRYQCRTTSAGDIEFVRINNFVGPTETVGFGSGAVIASTAAIYALTVSGGGSVKLFKNGSQFGTTQTITPANFGGAFANLTIGFSSGIADYSNAYFSEDALFASVLPDARILKMAQLAGFA